MRLLSHDSLRARLVIAAVVVTVALAFSGLVWQVQRPEPPAAPTVSPGPVGGAVEAQAAGVITAPQTPGEDGRAWQVAAHAPIRRLEWTQGTAHGPVLLLTDRDDSKEEPVEEPAVVGLDPQDGSVRWYRSLGPGMTTLDSAGSDTMSFHALQASEDGEHIAVGLTAMPSGPYDSNAPREDGRGTVVVMSAKTGEVVRTVETADLLLGMALTNDALIIQASPTLMAEGSTISTYSLASPKAKPARWSPGAWLVGATGSNVVLSERATLKLCGSESCSTTTVTQADALTGEHLSSLDGVYYIHPSGWVGRFTDPASSVGAKTEHPDWADEPSELVDLGTGARVDTTGRNFWREPTPTGMIWVLKKDGGEAPVWVDAAPGQDRRIRSEPVDIIGSGVAPDDMLAVFRTSLQEDKG
ncbi:hypothetical protein ACSL103130_01010 [Actinomyces slackii]|uniref:PQQ enzyme repeat n=1 Tax=Actinomyces slackii TaxID=52774 RepID=A0A3S4TBG6_9ACTO|nr:hypothetical protein [Actinomyces slackii]VEG74076.1 Uncharacterised protein [Actinomyces slackii]